MDSDRNPFAPGAGTRPPELAGRDEVIADATIVLKRVRAGRSGRSQMLMGLRGVGKTVLLNRLAEIADEQEFLTVVHRSGDIARALGEPVTSVAPLRNGLIRKGMIFSPAFGDTAFTVPMFDEFMRRSIADPAEKDSGRRRQRSRSRRS